MKNDCVAVLDVRSYEVTFLIGGKGVNDTFVQRGSKSEKYEGFTTDGFLDEESFCRAVSSCVSSVLQNYDGTISEICVGTPSAFTKIYTKGQTISFPTRRKLSAEEFDALYDAGLAELTVPGRCVKHSSMYYSLGDNRKYFTAKELYKAHSAVLKGALCYYFVDEKFYELITPLLSSLGFDTVRFEPQGLSQALYLLPEKKREGYALMLDVGFLTSTVCIVYGGGIVHEDTVDCGEAHILLSIMDGLGVDFEKAEEILLAANVSGGSVPKDLSWTDVDGTVYNVSKINEIIKFGLDGICEKVDEFFAKYYRDKTLPATASQSMCVTGEGIGAIKGGAEHISKRLERITEIVYPEIPYYDKPAYSSRIATLWSALSPRKKQGLKGALTKLFGGRKK